MKLENKLGIIAVGLMGLMSVCKQEQTQRHEQKQEDRNEVQCQTVKAFWNMDNEWAKRSIGFGRPLRICKSNVYGSSSSDSGQFKGIEYDLEIFYEGKGWEHAMSFSPGDNFVYPENRGTKNE